MEEVFHEAQPDLVAHLAALADVNQCEMAPDRATQVNLRGTEDVVDLSAQHQARLVYLSTEYVFRGDQGHYPESASPEPTTHYGRTKWEAEQAVAQHSYSWSIVRTSLVYGRHPRAGKANLASRIIDSLANGRTAYGHTDMYRSPIFVEDLVEGIIRVMGEEYTGVSHIAGPEWVHMGEFVHAVAQVFQLDSSLVVQTKAATDGASSSRPNLLGLDSTQTLERLGFHPGDLAAGLKKMQTTRREIS
jgi:dTDP-4-dehydrorhamnose reductase